MKRFFIRTYGCQMNQYDSEVAKGVLVAEGYTMTEDEEEADILLLVTCSVRQRAEKRVFGKLHEYAHLKKHKPHLVIGLLGCMAEYYKEGLLRDFPKLDFVCGTKKIGDLTRLIKQSLEGVRSVAVGTEDEIVDFSSHIQRDGGIHAWLPIMTGCNQFCSYCVVPYVRGREVSKDPDLILKEAEKLISQGYTHITLLGQNVNRYGKDGTDLSFPGLLDKISGINGLKRLGFMTSHPRDLTVELFHVIQKNAIVSRRFHLPLQSGSDRILKLMNRGHKLEDYRASVGLLRDIVPDISLTTDFIVGFPSESKEDFETTLGVLREIQFDDAYIFKYSARIGTPAAKMEDDVSKEEKEHRHQALLDTQRKVRSLRNLSWLGKTVFVLAESVSYKNKDELIGRTPQEKKVVFKCSPSEIGGTVSVKINDARKETLVGSLAIG